ncbi:MAG: DUF3095 domain-containing protein [Alphaproteobacteria bacterium]
MAPSQPTKSSNFYAGIQSFGDFDGFPDPSHYQPLPDDWLVVVADIRGSTKAIRAGRYKDVNMIGAACITAVLNIVGDIDVPYVFGGDGATLAVPRDVGEKVGLALLQTQTMAGQAYGLGLRVGIVPIADIRTQGCDVLVAKYRVSEGNHLALFDGGGIELADHLVKDEQSTFVLTAQARDHPNLEGLTCRWQPLASRHGKIVSLLVRATATEPASRRMVYDNIIHRLGEVMGGDLKQGAPTANENLVFRWPPRNIRTEALATTGPKPYWRTYAHILLQSLIQYFLHKFDRKAGDYDAPVYQAELIANTDYRRFDDMLRLVLDCTTAQIEAIESLLRQTRREGGIVYGLHMADRALMTCLVFQLNRGEHIHFIDGADGGFAVAATQLKAQVAGDDPLPE